MKKTIVIRGLWSRPVFEITTNKALSCTLKGEDEKDIKDRVIDIRLSGYSEFLGWRFWQTAFIDTSILDFDFDKR